MSVNQVLTIKITLRNKPSWTELNGGLKRLSLETETSAKFNRVKLRLDKFNQ